MVGSLLVRANARFLDCFRDNSAQLCVTSPPYWGKRRYGDHPEEVGIRSLAEYITETLEWTYHVGRILDDEGLFFLNIGDTSSGSGGAGGDHNKGGSKDGIPKYKQGKSGKPKMQSCLVPSEIALALQKQGWLVRQWITWDKGQDKPEDLKHVRRPRESSEVILMLAKSRDHRYNHLAHETCDIETGNVWHFPPVRSRQRTHFAPFPPELPRRAILLGTDPGMVVLDPFMGSGTTAEVANELDRLAIGSDLYAGV